MATVFTHGEASRVAAHSAASAQAPGFFQRLLRAIMEARQRQADREIAAIMARRGGIMLDELESRPARTPSRARHFHKLPAFKAE